MALLDDLETIIRTAYSEIMKSKRKKLPMNSYAKELNCDSYAYITKEIKKILIECSREGSVLNTTNMLIYKLLKKNFFIYENHVMAVFIGYKYLEKIAQVKSKFSTGGITGDATIEEISKLTATWA